MSAWRIPERYRIQPHGYESEPGQSYGYFCMPGLCGRKLYVIASDGELKQNGAPFDVRWEHVSVHAREGKKDRTPTWLEMALVKDLFWEPTACVVQYHPPASAYVNVHDHTLHLWRPWGGAFPRPPMACV